MQHWAKTVCMRTYEQIGFGSGLPEFQFPTETQTQCIVLEPHSGTRGTFDLDADPMRSTEEPKRQRTTPKNTRFTARKKPACDVGCPPKNTEEDNGNTFTPAHNVNSVTRHHGLDVERLVLRKTNRLIGTCLRNTEI